MIIDPSLMTAAATVTEALRAADWTIATAESCTGGLVAAALTQHPGASDVFRGGWVTYSNELKQQALEVPADLLATHGAVSGEVARAMAQGARAKAGASVALAITGIAGPGGATPDKPVGLAFVAIASADRTDVHEIHATGDRTVCQTQFAVAALEHTRSFIASNR